MARQEYALIVAGGKGARFGGTIPKQFLELNGRPILIHTLEAFYRYSRDINIVLVLPEAEMRTWEAIRAQDKFNMPVSLETGGFSRFQSVKRGLEKIPVGGHVAIHDGVRPLVTPEIIGESFDLARVHGAAVASVPLKESIRRIVDNSEPHALSRAEDRSLYRIIQTPQTFEVALIKKAYEIDEETSLTDDASVAEKAGFPVFLFEGHFNNIKITNREDLIIAQALMKER